MNLETLANELLLDVFEFLPIVYLFHAFNGLNCRFNTLISIFTQNCRYIDCRSMSKNQLDSICQRYLPSSKHRIISLHLSNGNETPQQIDRFFSHNLKFDQFIHLQSLSLYHLCSEKMMKKIMADCNHLPNLTHLKLSQCYFRYQQKDILYMINSIWSLPKLTHCHFDVNFRWQTSFIAPTVISSSLECLCIQGVDCHLNDLIRLFDHTIQLRYLCANIGTYIGNILSPMPILSMISLKLSFFSSNNSIHGIINLLHKMNNLRRLTVEALDIFIDGDQWKDIITKYLPKLEVFRLKMEFYFRDRINTKRYVDQLLNSFQTSFWLEEHQWFIRCHYHPKSASNYVCLYTLPYGFTSFPRIEVSGCQSTCINGEKQNWSYDHVHILNYRAPFKEDLTLYQCRFTNIQHLFLSLDADHQFWTIVPRFDRLISLEVSLNGRSDNVQSQLQSILDQAPRLELLKFGSWRTLELPIVELISTSIRQLDLRGCNRCFNEQECLTLINSPLGMQCEVLQISVEDRMNILDLITKMNNLRSLNVRCDDDKWNEKLSGSDDELITWLQHRLLSTYEITRHTLHIFNILVWIR